MAETLKLVPPKVDTNRIRHGGFAVAQIAFETGESLPVLVRKSDWIPLRVPTRWAVRRRRFECMENTLSRDLRGVALLYEWAAMTLKSDLDDMLERSEIPQGRQLESLIAFLRHKTTGSTDFNSLATVALKALSIRTFLTWVADPVSQGSHRSKSIQQMEEERAMLAALFRPIASHAVSAERIQPLPPGGFEAIDSVFGPVRDNDHRVVQPLRFHERNPFRPGTRLRNWLMMTIPLQCGHRRGELLKTRLDDIPRSTDVGLKIRRRPHDSADSRRYKPRVKTAERILPISHDIQIGLRAYLATPAPVGRRGGRSPYLFVSGEGAPLSISAADGIVKVIARHSGIDDLSWHSFRHTWAESLADDLLNRYPQDYAFEILRDLGGWKRGSNTPMHYIQNALRKRGIEFLRERNSRLYVDQEVQ
ncbi:MAG: site-specific integrase [Acidobacteriaceae bacterium]|jgi:integrase